MILTAEWGITAAILHGVEEYLLSQGFDCGVEIDNAARIPRVRVYSESHNPYESRKQAKIYHSGDFLDVVLENPFLVHHFSTENRKLPIADPDVLENLVKIIRTSFE